MNTYDIIRMAREASGDDWGIFKHFMPEIERFAALIAAGEREWVGLTDDEMLMIYMQPHEGFKYSLGRMVEAKLKEKNGF